MKNKNLMKKGITALLSAAVIAGVIPAFGGHVAADAAEPASSGSYAMNIGTAPLYANAGNKWNKDNGVKVYFGTYENKPTLFRVLGETPDTQNVAEQGILLDCDITLLDKLYSEGRNEGQRWLAEWKNSDLEIWLNSDNYYNSQTAFTPAERSAIQDTSFVENINYRINIQDYSDDVSSDKIFLLSAKEADELYENDDARGKVDENQGWWLRSRLDNNGSYVGIVWSCNDPEYSWRSAYGQISYGHTWGDDILYYGTKTGVSPALNLKASSVLFTSALTLDKTQALAADSTDLSTAAYAGDKIWKLTLKEDGKDGSNKKTVDITDHAAGTVTEDDTVHVAYTYTDTATTEAEKVNQVSVMITDKAYQDAGARILYYGALQDIKNAKGADSTAADAASGTGTFILPEALKEKTFGSDYHIYLLAEHAGSGNTTDYASAPAELKSLVNGYDITADAGKGGSISPNGIVKVKVGADQKFVITPEDGYEIDTVLVDGKATDCVTDYSFTNVMANHTISVTFKEKKEPAEPVKPEDYKIIDGTDGKWILNKDGSMEIRGNGEFSKFTGILVDGKAVDAENYTVREGSTIIALKADYLNSLPEGKHTFEMIWTDGSATTTFTVSRSASDTGAGEGGNAGNVGNAENQNQPVVAEQNNSAGVKQIQTGDNNKVGFWITALLASAAVLFLVLNKRKKETSEADRF